MVDRRRAKMFLGVLKASQEHIGKESSISIPIKLSLNEKMQVLEELIGLGFNLSQIDLTDEGDQTLLTLKGEPPTVFSFSHIIAALEAVVDGKKEVRVLYRNSFEILDFLLSYKVVDTPKMEVINNVSVISF